MLPYITLLPYITIYYPMLPYITLYYPILPHITPFKMSILNNSVASHSKISNAINNKAPLLLPPWK